MRFVEKLGEQSIFLYELYFIYSFMAYKNNFSFIMVVSILCNIILNLIFKSYTIQWGEKWNHKLPLFGSLCRPMDKECKKINVIGYGTPSGHSQIVAFIAAFYYFYNKDTEVYSKTTFGIFTLIALFTMATRYTSSRHSIPQILLGGSMGIAIAFILTKILHFIGI
jgi:membrane-associated phospholipid phosphatase